MRKFTKSVLIQTTALAVLSAGAFAMPEGVDCITLPAYAKATDGTYHARDLGIGVDALCGGLEVVRGCGARHDGTC